MNPLKIFNKLSKFPFGKNIFSFIVCMKAPYFHSIRPLFTELTSNRCVIFLKKRWRVLNHIGTVHAIAMCNACELAMGLTMQAGLPAHLRWIPKGMTVSYLKKATTNLTVVCDIPNLQEVKPGDVTVAVSAFDQNNIEVMRADIIVYISRRDS